MNIIKKTILLSDKVDKSKPQMMLELENKNNMIFGCVKSYNPKFVGDLVLGIKNGAKIVKQNLSFVDKKCQFKLSEPLNLNMDINCAVVDTSKDFEPILWGNAKPDASRNLISSLKESLGKLSKVSRPKAVDVSSQNRSNTCSFDDKQKILSSNIVSNQSEKCENSEVAMASMSLASENPPLDTPTPKADLFETSDEELDAEIDKGIKGHNFYDLISDQLAELFARYPREKNLEALIDGSEWCKIDSDTEGRYYVVGVIRKDDDIKYICYGVPGSYDVEPPRELRGYSQWLPTDISAPYTNGYWVMYQDSDTGENVMLN